MRFFSNSKVYVACPANIHSGGPELCHQLCSQLIQFGIDSKMFYVSVSSTEKSPVHDNYKKYHLPYTFGIEDELQNILIVPETFTEYLYLSKKIQRVLWWMSVDHYLLDASLNIKSALNAPLDNPMLKFFSFNTADNDIEHWVQSEYARQFVKLNGIPDERIRMVEDYLRPTFLSRAAQINLSQKENIAAYNPKKGLEVTKQLIEYAPDIDWRPIKNMTPEQVQELLAKAKIYIDFGYHPGKDRIPREAAISGCVVITGRRGAANNSVDINIPDEFKFVDQTTTVNSVIEKIREIFENFNAAYEKQKNYRARIFDDKKRFANEVATAFGIRELPRQSVALVQGLNEKTPLLVQELYQYEAFLSNFIVDDAITTENAAELLKGLIIREQNRNFVSDGQRLIEIITRNDAKFLYQEGRIKKFALIEPSASELDDLKNSYEAKDEDVLILS